jgi:hypothetical protein
MADGLRRLAIALGAAIAAAPVTAVHAQVFAEFGAGATWSSILVRDTIVDGFTAQPAIAPTLGLAIGTPVGSKYEVAIGISWAHSDLVQKQAEGSRDIIPLTVWTGTLDLRWQFMPWVSAQASVGAVKYSAAEEGREATMFRSDQPLEPTVGLGVRVDHPLGQHFLVALDLEWGFHRFRTQALDEVGFGYRGVNRVFLGATLRWSNAETTR